MTGFLKKDLAQLFRDIPVRVITPDKIAPVSITGIVLDSRAVQPGFLFVALKGENTDGHKYIDAALKNGAAAVTGMQAGFELPVPYILVEDTRFALAHISASFYGFPARYMTVIGVTGTDGKTTTSNLIYRILLEAGHRPGVISSVNAVIGDNTLDTGFHVTTPESPEVQRYLARMLSAGLTHVVLESTSHGLAQHRVTACEFDIGVITNITHEHLDYHRSFDAYREAKASLFISLTETHPKERGNPRLAVLNRDDASYEYLKYKITSRHISYGLTPGLGLWAEDIRHDFSGLHFIVRGEGYNFAVDSNLMGNFNVSNCLAALAATMIGLQVPPEIAQKGIAAMPGVTGRMERIHSGQDFFAIVDFAHTPNALRVALTHARQITEGRVIAVFGSAGLRDRQKRQMMPEIASELADLIILTAEDPRTESLDDILQEMSDAIKQKGGIEGETFWRIPDRGEAIHLAVQMAQPGDVVISCGKGHEQSMCFGDVEYPWDDRIAMQAALAERLGVKGPKIPILPTSK